MANARGGYMRNITPLWARGQDAFLVVRRSRDRSQLATLIWENFGRKLDLYIW